jgi:predicted DCC family thiol-disulfide oxidoreductase YuxK
MKRPSLAASGKTKIFYDGMCHVCSREIEHYRRRKGAENIRSVDITADGFNPVHEGLDPSVIHRVMHVKLEDGSVKTGVYAFIEIWKRLPGYHLLAKAAQTKILKMVLEFGYRAFVQIRPYLPRKKQACSNSPYCDL